MFRLFRFLLRLTIVLALIGGLAWLALRGRGWDSRARPGRVETVVAGRLRALMVPPEARSRTNPEPASEALVRSGLEHFADHCAVCHGNDGSGDTDFGRGLYPKPPDLRLPATQNLTDGELFYIIERGVPLTGMPGFGTGDAEGERASWHLVHFMRRLPKLTEEELAGMAELNPMSAEAWRQRMEELEFLRGADAPPAPAKPPVHRHKD